jgi:alanine dehydrogenase
MIVGIPKEIKAEEQRVAITPTGVHGMVSHGHRVLVERHAGLGSGIADAEFRQAGAQIVHSARRLWQEAEMVCKVKEPLPPEYRYLRPGLLLFTYLHLAASETLTRTLLEKQVCGIGYETIELDDGTLPLLVPMSEVAGRLSVQVGSWCLQAPTGGEGILLAGASGVRPAHVVVLGAGVVGLNAAQLATGVGANVNVIDKDPTRLRYAHDILGGHITTLMSNRANIDQEVAAADLVIGAVLVAGTRAPKLVSRKQVRAMKPGSAIVDVAIDQGGCVETSRPTTLDAPTYVTGGVVHYCVTNMPAIVPRTSTFALTNSTLAYALELADEGLHGALRKNRPLQRGVNVFNGQVTHAGVAAAFGLEHTAVDDLM